MSTRVKLPAWELLVPAVLSVVLAWIAVAKPAAALAAPAAVLVALLVYRRPEAGALAILVLVILLPRSILFDRGIPFGGGNLKATDVLLALTLGAWLVRATVSQRPIRLPASGTFTLLLVGFLGLALIGVATAHFAGTPQKLALLELRPLLSFLLVFVLVDRARTVEGVERFVRLVLVALAGASLIAVTQYVVGHGSGASYAGNAIRVIGWSAFSLLGLVWALVLLPFARSRRERVLLAGLTVLSLAGEFVSFQRTAWVATLVALAVGVALMRAGRRRRLVGWIAVLLVAGLVAVSAVNAVSSRRVGSPVSAAVSRLHSVLAFRNDVSAGRRVNEWDAATNEIERHPLGGIGLGSSITFFDPEFSTESNHYGFFTTQYYIHNSYLWLALKLGLPGLIVFLLLLGVAAANGVRAYRVRSHPRLTPLVLGGLVSLVVLAVQSIGGPELTDDNTAPVAAAIIALLVAAPRLARTSPAAAPAANVRTRIDSVPVRA